MLVADFFVFNGAVRARVVGIAAAALSAVLNFMRLVGWPGGISPPGSHGTVRDISRSHRSSHLIHSNARIHAQCAKRRGCLVTSRSTTVSHA